MRRQPGGAVVTELLVLVLVGLVGAAGFLIVHSPGARRALLREIAAVAEKRYDVALAADDFEWRPREGRLVVEKVRLGAPGSPPALTADAVVVQLKPSALLGASPTLEGIELVRPRLDLEAPLPELPADEGAGGGGSLTVRRFAVREGSIVGLPPPEVPGGPQAVRVQRIVARGSLVNERLELRIDGARVALTGGELDGLVARLSGALAGPVAGPWRISGVALEAPGLEAALDGELGLGEAEPMTAQLRLVAEPGRLLPGRDLGGRLEAEGRLDLRRGTGAARVSLTGLPGEALRPWLAESAPAHPPLDGTSFELEAELERGPEPPGRLGGRIQALWRRGERPLLRADLRPSSADGVALEVPVELRLLPRAPGVRRARARLVVDSLDEPLAGRWRDGRIEIGVADGRRLESDLEALWPGLLGPLPPEAERARSLLAGALRVDGEFEGPLAEPRLEVQAALASPGGAVRLAASHGPAGHSLVASAEEFDLAVLGIDGVAGQVAVEAGLEGPSPARGELSLVASRLALPGQAPIDRLELGARSDGARVEITQLRLERSGTVVTGSGELTTAAFLEPPLVAGGVDLTVLHPSLGEDAVPLALRLRDGVAELASTRAAGSPFELRAEVPLGWLGAALDGLVRAPAAGPVTADWQLPERDWAPLLTAAGVSEVERLLLGGRGRLVVDPDEPAGARLTALIEALDLRLAGLDLRAETALAVELDAGRLRLEPARVRVGGVGFALGGSAEMREQRVLLALDPLAVEECSGRLSGEVAAALLGLATADDGVGAPLDLAWSFPACDWSPLLGLLGAAGEARDEPRAAAGAEPRLTAAVAGCVRMDPEAPAAAAAELEIGALDALVEGVRLTSERPLRFFLEGGRLAVDDARIVAADRPFDLAAVAELEPAWAPGDALGSLVRALRLEGRGTLTGPLVEPLLVGGSASGELDLEVAVEGPLEGLTGRVRASGPGFAILYPTPYLTRLSAPELALTIDQGRVALDGSRFTLNEGRVQLLGGFGLDGALDLRAVLAEVRYRLDYGLLVTLGGYFDWRGSLDGDSTLSGKIRVAQGLLSRPIRLDRDLLADLLVPVDLTGTGGGPLAAIALDLELSTREGVRVRNNLADLVVRWEPLRIRGTAEAPLIEGTLEVQPGGIVYAPGEALLIERASITYPGRPGVAPIVDLATTTTRDEARASRRTLADPLGLDRYYGDGEELEEGGPVQDLALYFGEQLAERVGETLGGTGISIRPIPVFGEADPATRLNITRDFSPTVAVVASIGLANAEAQTYILDVHDLPSLPRLSGQLFTSDAGTEGVTVQQSVTMGGGHQPGSPGARIRRLEITGRPPGVSRRELRRALPVEKGRTFGEGDRFSTEVEASELLRRNGYPGASAVLSAAASGKRGGGVDLALTLEPGPRVAFLFDGDALPRRLRESITSLYRADFWEAASIEEMKTQAVRVLRSRGHLDPEVEVEVRPVADGRHDRLVVVRSEAGRRIEPGPPLFAGLEPEQGEWLARRFWAPVQRVELAAGLPEADQRVRQGLADLGYPQGEVVGRSVGEAGSLVVEVRPGPRRRVAAVEVEGFDGEVAPPPLEPGEAARADRVAAGAVALDRELARRGYADARVWARQLPVPGEPLAVTVRYEIEPGERSRFARPRFEGLGATRESWARRVAELPVGEPFDERSLEEARRRLYRTGLFSGVGSRVERDASGEAVVVFELEQRPRFRLSYGLRWDSDDGASAVVDAADSNFLGRGMQLGVRALASSDDRSLRGALEVPRAFGGRGTHTWFNLVRRLETEAPPTVIISERLESTLQFAYPLGRELEGRVYGSWFDSHVFEEDPDPFFPIDERIQSPRLGLQLLYDRRGGELLPERGLFASLDLSGSGDFIGGDFRYVRAFGQLHLFRPAGRVAGRPLVWAQSYRFGAADEFDQELFRPIRFFAGGEYSVRGYPTESLGPQERLGRLVRPRGGLALAILNQELRYQATDALTALVFVDAGNVWRRLGDVDTDLAKSVGLGLRAVTPLGLLRLDFAYLLDRRPGDPETKLHVGLGTVF